MSERSSIHEDPHDEVRAYRERSYSALSDAQYLLEGERALSAVARTYYAAYYMATAAVLAGGERPKTHKGLRTRFHALYVETGRVRPQYAQVFDAAREARENADYDAFTEFDVDMVQPLLDDVESFMYEVEGALGWEHRFEY